MHLSFISTRGQAGLDAPSVTVEVHLSAGLPAFQVVGLGDSRSREIRSRVRSGPHQFSSEMARLQYHRQPDPS